jgi:hypothetical protein
VASLVNIATDFEQSNLFYQNSQISSTENHRRTRATKIIKELSEISLRNPLEVQKDNELFQQTLSMFQMNQNQAAGATGSAILQHELTIKDFPEFFMKCFDYFNRQAFGQSMHNQQIISNFQLDL